MEEYFTLLQATPLFAGFHMEELGRLAPQLGPAVRDFEAGETLILAGDDHAEIGVVLAGEIEAAKFTRAGEQFTVSRMGAGGVFGDVLSGSHTRSPVTVRAATACRVMLFDCGRLFARPPADEGLHWRLLVNLVGVISDKYFALDKRMDLLLVRGLRRRIAAYLLDAGRGQAGGAFTIPFTRAGLAHYLGCERSALSREISAMAAAGLIEVRRSRFRIPDAERLRGLF